MPSHPRPVLSAIALLLILLVAATLRWASWPGRYEMRDIDEPGYSEGGLALFEGIPPGYKNSPGGPLFWVEWVATAGTTAEYFARPTDEERRLPIQIRVFAVIERALFDGYHDLSGLRETLLSLNFALGLAGVIAAFRYGLARGGLAGAIAVGGLAAALPLFVEYGAMSRPYSPAWSLMFLALAAAGTSAHRPALWASVYIGLAIATRIECVLFLPFLWWELWDRGVVPGLVHGAAKVTLSSFAIALLLSPWMATNLFGMLRAIATIQVANPASQQTSLSGTLHEVLTQGLLLPAVTLLIALIALAKSPRSLFSRFLIIAYLAALGLSTFKATGFGLHHKGPQVVGIIAALAVAFAWIAQRAPRAAIPAALLVIAWPLAEAMREVAKLRGPDCGDAPIEWVEANVPPGTRVFMPGMIRTLLPTEAAADRMWDEVTAPDAYKRKLEAGMKRFSVAGEPVAIPRALSEENLTQERGNYRRAFILGAPLQPDEPRFDVDEKASQLFGPVDLPGAFLRDGGVLIYRPGIDGDLTPDLGTPAVRFRRRGGQDTLIFLSPEVRARIPNSAFP